MKEEWEYIPDTTEEFLRQCREEKTGHRLDLGADTTEVFLQQCKEDRIRKGYSRIPKGRTE